MTLEELYRNMALSRAFELAIAELWRQGKISGEMHLGTGEEAVMAGVAAHLVEGDAVALDHRSTPMLAMLGVDPGAILLELLGQETGLCKGRGGHMHLFSKAHLAASSGIVGAAGPAAAGFGLAAKRLRKGKVAVAFFGEGAANQGMLLESLNLAVAWSLPVVFVCKDNQWAIMTRSAKVTGGKLVERARGFGLRAEDVDGLDAMAVWKEVGRFIERARAGKGPSFLLARCSRLDGHYLGDALVRSASASMAENKETLGPILSSAVSRGGGGIGARLKSLGTMTDLIRRAGKEQRDGKHDPIFRARKKLGETAQQIEAEVATRVEAAVAVATGGAA